MTTAVVSGQAVSEPLLEPADLIKYELSEDAVFPSFNASTAFDLGIAIRARILSLPASQRKPAVISISSATTGDHILFQAVTESGTLPDNENWVRRKRNTVLRWGLSSWALRRKILSGPPEVTPAHVEAWFAQRYGLKSSVPNGVPDDYAIHGGGFPIRVANVDQVVGVVVVSGLKQEHDHQVIVEVVRDFLKGRK